MSFGRAVGPAIGGTVWSWGLASGLPFPLDSHALVRSLSFDRCRLGSDAGLFSSRSWRFSPVCKAFRLYGFEYLLSKTLVPNTRLVG